MSLFGPFRDGPPQSIFGESLAFAAKNRTDLREAYQRAIAEISSVRNNPPAHWTDCQRELALQQAQEDAKIIAGQLAHAEQRFQWEIKHKK